MPYGGLNLDGMVALVTGSGRGIGEALAIGLAQAGGDVAVSELPQRMAEACSRSWQFPHAQGLGPLSALRLFV